MPEHDGEVDLRFPEPRMLVTGRKNLHGHFLVPPLAQPDLAKATLANHSAQPERQ